MVSEEDLGTRRRLHGHRGNQAAHAHRAQDGEDLPVALGVDSDTRSLAEHVRSVGSFELRRHFHQRI